MPFPLDHATRNTDYRSSALRWEHAPGREEGATGQGRGAGGSRQKPPKTWRLAVIKKWHQVIIIQIGDCISQNSADGVLLAGSAKNILADTALSLWFTRHTRALLQEGDPAWALARLQVNAQLKVAAAAMLRQGVPWRRALPRRLFPNYLSIVNRGNLKKKKNSHIKKQTKPWQNLASVNTDVLWIHTISQQIYGKISNICEFKKGDWSPIFTHHLAAGGRGFCMRQ